MALPCAYKTPNVWMLTAALWCVSCAVAEPTAPSPTSAQATVLRIARSQDGMKFRDTGVVFLSSASAPDLVRLDNGEVVALFDYAAGRWAGGEIIAMSRSEDDGISWSSVEPIRIRGSAGRSIPAKHGDLAAIGGGYLRLFFSSAVASSSKRDDKTNVSTIVRTAVTRDCVDFRLDKSVVVDLSSRGDMHVSVGWIDENLHIYGATVAPIDIGLAQHAESTNGKRFAQPTRIRVPEVNFVGSLVSFGRGTRAYVSGDGGVRSLVSRDGRRWKLEPGIRLADAWDPAVIRLRDGSFMMIYCTWPEDTQSPPSQLAGLADHEVLETDEYIALEHQGDSGDAFVDGEGRSDFLATDDAFADTSASDDNPEIALLPGQDSAKLQPDFANDGLGDNRADSPATGAGVEPGREWVEADEVGGSDWSADSANEPGDRQTTQETDSWDEEDAVADATPSDASDERARFDGSSAGNDADSARYRDEADETHTTQEATSANAAQPGDQSADSDYKDNSIDATDYQWTTSGPDDWPEQNVLAFVPLPDFNSKIDYMSWYRERALEQPEDNAYDAYSKFIPGPGDTGANEEDWPELSDMFNDRDHDAPPGPWDPADHPEWEESSDGAQELLSSYREAATHDGYASPARLSLDGSKLGVNDADLLIQLLLPSLSAHRAVTKATLADSWRLRDDKVSVDRLLQAWKTALRGASHVARGATLIEELVAMADQNLVRYNARWALKQVDFTTDQLESALTLFVKYDRRFRDPMLAIVGEHATNMDALQHVFMPAKPGDEPRLNIDRARRMLLLALESEPMVEDALKGLAKMSASDIRDAIAVSNEYYRRMGDMIRIGYPTVRESDTRALADEYIHANAWTELLIPNLSRFYKLRARTESLRRATQLTLMLHLFKAQEGRWPSSLHELRTSKSLAELNAITADAGSSAAGAVGRSSTPGATGGLSASEYRASSTSGSVASQHGAGATSGASLSGVTGPGAPGPASAYFDRITTDPFTGKAFGYRLGDDGPILYSFSENAEDDGGNHSPGWDDKITNAGDPDDFVFWPPQIRPRRR